MSQDAAVLKQEEEVARMRSNSPTLIDEPAAPGLSEAEKPKGAALYLILLGLYLCTFLFCLDISIVAPAIPKITDDFKTTEKATWFFSIYLAINTAFQPTSGPILRINQKWAFLGFTVLFEIGSLICAVAPNANVFIFGRALAGLGCAGGYVGVMAIIATIAPIEQQALLTNLVGAVYSIGAVAGPLIGGAFTEHVTWRWCFYINLPLGGVTLLACTFLLKSPHSTVPLRERTIAALKETDPIGLTLVVGALIDILLVFEKGGTKWAWDDSKIIGLIVGFGLMVITLCGWIWFRGEKAYIRPRLLKDRTIVGSMLCNFAIGGAYFTLISVLAYYYQIRGSGALRSGVQLLPLIAGVVLSLIVGGGLAPAIGYVNPLLLVGMIIFAIGMGCVTLLDEHTATAMWAGITFLCGFGSGLAFMMPFVLSQTIFTQADREIGTAMVLFPQTCGGALYLTKYKEGVDSLNLPEGEQIVSAGITAFRHIGLSPEDVSRIEVFAIDALRRAYYMPIVILALAILCAWPFLRWNSVKPPPKEDAIKSHDLEKVDSTKAVSV